MPGPRAAQNLQMPHPRDWQDRQMPRSSPGGGGGGGCWAQLELTDAQIFHVIYKFICYIKAETRSSQCMLLLTVKEVVVGRGSQRERAAKHCLVRDWIDEEKRWSIKYHLYEE